MQVLPQRPANSDFTLRSPPLPSPASDWLNDAGTHNSILPNLNTSMPPPVATPIPQPANPPPTLPADKSSILNTIVLVSSVIVAIGCILVSACMMTMHLRLRRHQQLRLCNKIAHAHAYTVGHQENSDAPRTSAAPGMHAPRNVMNPAFEYVLPRHLVMLPATWAQMDVPLNACMRVSTAAESRYALPFYQLQSEFLPDCS